MINYNSYFADICDITNATSKETAYKLDIDIDGTMGLCESQKIKYLSVYKNGYGDIIFRVGNAMDENGIIDEDIDNMPLDEVMYIYNEIECTKSQRDELIDIDDLDDFQIFDMCANKSLGEINAMKNADLKHQALRYYFSRLLANYPEEEPLQATIKVNDETTIIALSQTPCEGFINVMFAGSPEWNDIDVLNNDEQYKVLEELEK